MSDTNPSSGFNPFDDPDFRYNPAAPLVQSMHRPPTTLSEFLHPEVAELRAALGIPQGQDIWRYEQWDPLGRHGYFFDLIGTYETADTPKNAPRFWFQNPPATRGQGYTARDAHDYGLAWPPLIAWRRRVVYQQPPPWLEACWHPDTGVRIALQGLEAAVRPEHIRWTLQGRQLLRQLERRGRRPGPAGFEDAQEFEDTLVHLIQAAHSKGQGTKQARIATLLRPELDRRRGSVGSAASVDIDTESTIRLIRKHLSCPWHDLVRKALQAP